METLVHQPLYYLGSPVSCHLGRNSQNICMQNFSHNFNSWWEIAGGGPRWLGWVGGSAPGASSPLLSLVFVVLAKVLYCSSFPFFFGCACGIGFTFIIVRVAYFHAKDIDFLGSERASRIQLFSIFWHFLREIESWHSKLASVTMRDHIKILAS